MPDDGLQWVSDLGKMAGVPTPQVDARIAGGSSAIRSAGSAKSAKSAKPTQDEITYAEKTIGEYRADIDKAQATYQATKASADQLAEVTGHKFDDPGKDLTSRAEVLNQALASWTKALQGNDRDAETKARAAAEKAHDSMTQVVTNYQHVVQSAKPDKLPGKKFHTDWGDLMAIEDKGAATALSLVADLKKAIAANYSSFDGFLKTRDMFEFEISRKPMADFLAKPESVQAAVQKSAQDNKGKISDAQNQARHADRIQSEDEDLASQLATVKTLVDQMTKSVAAIDEQKESEHAEADAAELKEKAEGIESAFEFMGEVATCLTGDPKEAAGKLGELALKTGFKLLGKLATRDIRERAEELHKMAVDKHNKSLTDSSEALIKALDDFDKIAPDLEMKINALAKRFETQMKQVGEKFDNVCENGTFHFYDVESAVKDANTALGAAASGRGALDEDALSLPDAIGRAVLRTSRDLDGPVGQAMEQAYKRINGPTIGMARQEVERHIRDWKTEEKKITESLGQLLEVRKQALQALADFSPES
jgi:hypothetical protein